MRIKRIDDDTARIEENGIPIAVCIRDARGTWVTIRKDGNGLRIPEQPDLGSCLKAVENCPKHRFQERPLSVTATSWKFVNDFGDTEGYVFQVKGDEFAFGISEEAEGVWRSADRIIVNEANCLVNGVPSLNRLLVVFHELRDNDIKRKRKGKT